MPETFDELKYFYCWLILALGGCLSQDDMVIFSAAELDQLLASDSVKTWVLVDRFQDDESIIEECELDDELILLTAITAQDTAKLHFLTGPVRCPGQVDSLIFQGTWQAIDSTNNQIILWVVDDDTSYRNIDFITSQQFTISYLLGDRTIRELFIDPSL